MTTVVCTRATRQGRIDRVLGARIVRAAALFCPLVEEPEREAVTVKTALRQRHADK